MIKTFLLTVRKNKLRFGGFATFYIITALVISACSVLTYKLTGDISQAALAFEVDVFVRFLAVMAVIAGIKALTSGFNIWLTGRFSARAGYALRKNFASHFTFLRFDAFEKQNSGVLLSLYANDVPKAASFVTDGVLGLVSEVLYVVVVFIYMMTVNPFYTLIFFIMFPLLIFMQVKISVPIQHKALDMSTERANFNAVVNDSLQNIITIAAYSLETRMEERYLSAYDRYFAATKAYIRSLLSLVLCGIIATQIPTLFIYIVSGVSVVSGRMSVSEFIAFTAVSGIAGSWLSMLSQRLQTLQMSSASALKINEQTAATEEDTETGQNHLPNDATAVAFDKVSFSYDGTLDVLRDISFTVKKGEHVAIVGPSGSGKSTLLKLLLSLYDPSGGVIRLSGQPVDSLAKKTARSFFAYVPQDCFLFAETIRENLIRVSADAERITDEQLEKACKDAGILPFINSLPERFDTVLSESAENLSGGQRQRLAIARAYLQDAPVVLFDEATSALDTETEAEVLRAFDTLMKDKTVIMVTHRLAAVRACDTVVMIENGHVAGVGSHAALITGCAPYAALCQSLDHEGSDRHE